MSDDRAQRDRRNYSYIGSYVFAERASALLRQAEQAAEQHEEVLTAISMQIRFCDEVVDDCKATLERVETLLRQKQEGNGKRLSSRGSEA